MARTTYPDPKSTRTKPQPYALEDVYRFKGKSRVRRENYDLGLPCGCKAYRDVLTRGRWNALGYLIRKGESACHRAGKHALTPIFCRCQVEPKDPSILDAVSWQPGDAIPGFEGVE